MSSQSSSLSIIDVSYAYGENQALDDVSFEIPNGSLFGILGPNGSGKTTLFRMITTLLRPDSGRVELGGMDVASNAAAVRERIGSVFQQPALDEELTIRENIRTAASLYGLKKADGLRRLEALSRAFDIDDRLGDRVSTLSGGLKRRADLIRGLIHSPDLLLLDEPTSALDPMARRMFWDHLSALRRAEGTTMVAATHLMDEAERCDLLAILDRGRLVDVGSPAKLVEGLGGASIWLETADPVEVAAAVTTRFGWTANVVGRSVQVRHSDPYTALAPLHDSLGRAIHSATIRKPSLEDVFILRTGRRLDAESADAAAPRSLNVQNA
jgi:ABC-2 type transport system ATP-binding protein